MKVQNEEERQAAAQTLKEVMQKLEEAWRLARKLEEESQRALRAAHHDKVGAGRG
jgi:predicted translin family RNA/ssDNA-binding protein